MNGSKLIDDENKLEELRQKALQESEEDGKKERFGLFRFIPPTSIGDSSYKQAKRRTDPEGNIITEKPNIKAAAHKKGKTPDAYLKYLGPLSNGKEFIDEFVDSSRMEILKNRLQPGGVKHEKPFFPAVFKENIYRDPDGKRARLGVSFEYKEQGAPEPRERRWDSDKKIITAGRNILSSSPKKGHYSTTVGHTIGKYPEWMEQGYDGGRIQERKEKERLREILKAHDKKPFKSTHYGHSPFYSEILAYGLDDKAKTFLEHSMEQKAKKKETRKLEAKHDKPFRPSHPLKSGKIYGALNKFPEHMKDPIWSPSRQKKDEKETKAPFK